MVDYYGQFPNVMWVTENSEPFENLVRIQNSNIKLVRIEKYDNPGYGNINLQTISTSYGIDEAKKNRADFIIKIRSDCLIIPFEKFVDVIAKDKMGVLAYVKSDFCPNSYYQLLWQRYVDAIKENYNNLGYIDGSYVTDYIVAGPTEDMDIYWKNIFDHETRYVLAAEYKLLYGYLIKKGLLFDTSIKNLSKHFDIWLDKLKTNKIQILSLKYDTDYVTALLNNHNVKGNLL